MPNQIAEKNRTQPRAATEARGGHRRRRRPSRLAYGLMLAAAAACLVTAVILVFFRVQTVRVDGAAPYTAEQVRQASGIGAGENLLGVDPGRVAARITRELPYIRSVRVTLRPPSTVVLAAVAGKAAGAVAVKDGYALLDADGKVLELRADLKGLTLPLVRGLRVSSAAAGEKLVADAAQKTLLSQIQRELEADKLGGITQIDLSNALELSVVYENRVTIELGTSSDLARKVRFAAYLLSGKITAQEKGNLDVSKVGTAYFDPS